MLPMLNKFRQPHLPQTDVGGSVFLVVLVSGGRSSAMMARHIQLSPKYANFEILYVFCNTGMERPQTVNFLKNMVKYWEMPLNIIEGVYSNVPGVGVKSKVVDFESMDMSGRVFSEAIEHLNKLKWIGVPNSAIPYCSEYLKSRVSHDFARNIFGTTKYIKAIGYRLEDMPKRITFAELRADDKRIAPLLTDFENIVGQKELNVFFENEPFKLELHSDLGNCELCWKKSKLNLVKVLQFGTRFVDWHKKEEQKYGNMFFRENLSITDLVKLSESGIQTNMFEEVEDSCVCSFS